MARVAIVSYHAETLCGQSGEFGAFTAYWANKLREAGEDVTIVRTRTDRKPMSVDTTWKLKYQAHGIGLIELQSPPALTTRWPDVPTMRVSELATPVLKNFDIVYLQDWGNAGFDLLRARRYVVDQGPVCVTVLHGPSAAMTGSSELSPDVAEDLHLAYQERYSAKYSDFAVSPTAAMARRLRELGWVFPGEVEVLGEVAEAEDRWMEFHRRALASAGKRVEKTLPAVMPTVDVVTTYYQKGTYLPQFVDALEHQTTQGFCVLAVNDGSPDEESNRVFAEQAERAAKHGWKFVRTENQWVDAARNTAAAMGTGEFLLFVDTDDVPARNAVERLREALVRSGDDALVPSSFLFASDRLPYNLETGAITAPAYATCIPLGMDLVGGLIDPSSFGGSMFMVRRSAFDALQGFRELRGAGHEDWEMYVRLALAGYKVDAMADQLQFYRQVEDSLARTMTAEASRLRLIDAYEASLRQAGLAGVGLAIRALTTRNSAMERQLRMLRAQTNERGRAKRSSFAAQARGRRLGRLKQWYRSSLSMEMRLKIHRMFLSPFVDQHEPPSL